MAARRCASHEAAKAANLLRARVSCLPALSREFYRGIMWSILENGSLCEDLADLLDEDAAAGVGLHMHS